jgi:hypothetical protein
VYGICVSWSHCHLNLRTILAQRFVSWEGLIQVVAVCPPYTYDGHMLSVFSPLATLKKSSSPFTSKCAPRAHHQPSHSASAADTPPYPHSNDNIAIIETDTAPQSTLLSINPNPSTICLPLSRSRTPDSDDRTAIDCVPLSRCSTGPEPEVESFTEVLVANGKYNPATRHTTSASKRG